MSLPRRVLPDQVQMITRRVAWRRFLLRPSKSVTQLVEYALGVAVERYGILIHAVIVESNHYHLVLTDPRGRLPDFEHDFDQLVARSLNTHYGIGESFWAPGSYSNVEIYGGPTLVDKLLYVWTNAVKDGLVARPEQWPGLRSLPEDMGRRTVVTKKPDMAFFGGRRPETVTPAYEDGKRLALRERRRRLRERVRRYTEERGRAPRDRSTLPEESSFQITVPAAFADMELREVHRMLRAELEARIEAIHLQRRAEGKTRFPGAAAIKQQDPFGSAGGSWPTFRLNARIACKKTELRIQLLVQLKEWRARYRRAYLAWKCGQRRATFPHGTWALRTYHSARVEAA